MERRNNVIEVLGQKLSFQKNKNKKILEIISGN